VWRTGRELDALARHHPGSPLPRPIEELLAPLTDCEPSQRGNLLAVVRIQLVQRISVIRHIAGNLVLLGLIGTVVGFIIALSAVDPTTAGDVRSVAPMVAALVNGMSTALYTTLVGSILHIWLMCNHQLLASATARLLSAVATLVESRRE
jgi:biopolymer transport protein ExbB/TolQ